MSARAAWRLEDLGFAQVYRYVAGKADWFASGLPRAGRLANVPRAGDIARADVPTCAPDERVGEVRTRMRDTGWGTCVVVNRERVVLGVLRKRSLGADPASAAADVMQPGPRTFRPDVLPEGPLRYMQERGLADVLITTSDGVLVGALRQEDAERHVRESGGTA